MAASYTYDAEGLRAAKTVNGVNTTYQYLGGQLQYEKKSDTEVHYLYDANGVLKGLRTVEAGGTVKNYYVVTNTRGDVTQIYNEAGDLQAAYTYDSWGKILSIKDGAGNEVTSDSSIGKLNSLRYRGYYYDDETKLYYLQSRYYNPELGRFINADGIISNISELFSANMFAYCINNPINLMDPTGYKWQWGKDYNYKGWDIRFDRANSSKGKSHVHVEKGKKSYSQNDDGSPHDGSVGEPPQKVKDELEDMGWDWDGKEQAYKHGQKEKADNTKKAVIAGVTAVGSGYIAYRIVRFAPSLLPPLWWTIPANAVCP